MFLGRIQRFMKYFFVCDPCRTHFLEVTDRTPFEKARTHQEAILWLWQAHNEANARLSEEEAEEERHGEASKNPKKMQYPSRELCPKCYADACSAAFCEREELAFLERYYGNWPVHGGNVGCGGGLGGGHALVVLTAFALFG